MLGAVWTTIEGSSMVSSLIRILYRASSNDPLLRAIAGDGRHCHGFGYVLAFSEGRGWRLSWERYDSADDLGVGEESCQENLRALEYATENLANKVRDTKTGIIVLHARRAGRKEPRGSLHAHPFIESIYYKKEGYRLIALAHNGSVDKPLLASRLNIENYEVYTDSHILTLWLAQELRHKRDGIKELLDSVQNATKTALDLLIADVCFEKTKNFTLHIYSFLSRTLNRQRVEYYKPVIFKGTGIQGYMSSTMLEYAEREALKLSVASTSAPAYMRVSIQL